MVSESCRWVASVISTGSPVSRVFASTRDARLTASPMTLKESLPAPPIDPATTLPELTPIPISKPPGFRLLTVRAISTAHCTARSAWLSTRSGAFHTASRPSPTNWSTWPRWRPMIGTITSKSSFRRETISEAETPTPSAR